MFAPTQSPSTACLEDYYHSHLLSKLIKIVFVCFCLRVSSLCDVSLTRGPLYSTPRRSLTPYSTLGYLTSYATSLSTTLSQPDRLKPPLAPSILHATQLRRNPEIPTCPYRRKRAGRRKKKPIPVIVTDVSERKLIRVNSFSYSKSHNLVCIPTTN